MEDLDLFIWKQLRDKNYIKVRFLSINFKSGEIKFVKNVSKKRQVLTIDLHLVYQYSSNNNISDTIENSKIIVLFSILHQS